MQYPKNVIMPFGLATGKVMQVEVKTRIVIKTMHLTASIGAIFFEMKGYLFINRRRQYKTQVVIGMFPYQVDTAW